MSERDWISRYFKPLATSEGAAGLMDDVARLAGFENPGIITVDSLVETIHFRPVDPLPTVVRKLVRVNVSDIFASGAAPREALLALGWPKGRPETGLAEFAAALGEELQTWGITLVGGDTVSAPVHLFVSLTLTGECLSPAGPVRRSGAGPGDDVWVTGEIGAARLGYLALEAGDSASPWGDFYRVPALPPASAARLVADHASAAMDVSDGLFQDARTLAIASGVSLRLDLECVPFAGDKLDQEHRIALATWGDDYQILFTAPSAARQALQDQALGAGIKLTRIGSVTGEEPPLTVLERGIPVNLPERLGFEHG